MTLIETYANILKNKRPAQQGKGSSMAHSLAIEAGMSRETPPVRRTVVIKPGTAPYLPDAEARREYDGLSKSADVFAVISLTDEAGGDHLWLVTSSPHSVRHAAEFTPAAENTPRPKSVVREAGKHAAAGASQKEVLARIVPLRNEEGNPRLVANELAAAEICGGEGIRLQDILRRRVMRSHEMPGPSTYGELGDGLVSVNEIGSIVIDTFLDDPAVHVIAPQGAQIAEGGILVK